MNLNNVNKRNTREWAMFNGNSKGEANRNKLVEKHGGSWERRGTLWFWNPNNFRVIKFPNAKRARNMFVFTSKDGVSYILKDFAGNEILTALPCMKSLQVNENSSRASWLSV
jgi:hypothetical protein